jgi:hypothetical protein
MKQLIQHPKIIPLLNISLRTEDQLSILWQRWIRTKIITKNASDLQQIEVDLIDKFGTKKNLMNAEKDGI